MPMIRVLLVDDSSQFRAVMRRVLERQDDIAVVDEAENGREAVEKTKALDPDVVLMDVSMPKLDGIAATRHLREQAPKLAVILVSIGNKPQEVAAGMAAGATKYLVKGATMDEIVAAVRECAAGHTARD